MPAEVPVTATATPPAPVGGVVTATSESSAPAPAAGAAVDAGPVVSFLDSTPEPSGNAWVELTDIKPPEGVDPKSGLFESAKSAVLKMANSGRLTQAQAELVLKERLKEEASIDAEIDARNRTWAKQLLTSPRIQQLGADDAARLKAGRLLAEKALEWSGDPELKNIIVQGGFSNHPGIISFLVKVGQSLQSDSVGGAFRPAADLTPAQAEAARISRLYSVK